MRSARGEKEEEKRGEMKEGGGVEERNWSKIIEGRMIITGDGRR